MAKNSLVGTWRLISMDVRTGDGQVFYPFGQDAVGHLVYTGDGYMSIAVMKADRPKVSSDDLRLGSTEQKAAAAETYASYCGKYEVRGKRVFHHIEVCLLPDWCGVTLKRGFEVQDDTLTLISLPYAAFGTEMTGYATWKRAHCD